MPKREYTADDLSGAEILDRQIDMMISDAMDDLRDFALGALSKEALADRFEAHRAVAIANATTELCDELNHRSSMGEAS